MATEAVGAALRPSPTGPDLGGLLGCHAHAVARPGWAPLEATRHTSSISYRVGKPLRFDLEGYWSARRGQYRVVYSIQDDEVLVGVVRISHRADVYG